MKQAERDGWRKYLDLEDEIEDMESELEILKQDAEKKDLLQEISKKKWERSELLSSLIGMGQ